MVSSWVIVVPFSLQYKVGKTLKIELASEVEGSELPTAYCRLPTVFLQSSISLQNLVHNIGEPCIADGMIRQQLPIVQNIEDGKGRRRLLCLVAITELDNFGF